MPIDPTYPFASEKKKDTLDGAGPAFHAWKKTPTPQTRSAVLTAIQPAINSALTTYSNGIPSPTLKSRAKLMALQALETYDPDRGNLRTHLLSQLQSLRRIAGGETQVIPVPERVILQRHAVENATRDLEDKLGRPASVGELSEHVGISPKRLAYIRQAHMPVNTGASLGADGEVFSPASSLPGDNARNTAWQEFVHRDLDPVNQLVLEHTTGLYGRPKLSTNRLASKLSLSAGAISQRKAKIQSMLDEGGSFGI